MPGGSGAPGRTAYLDMPVGEFLDELAAARPDPGGGSAAALAVSLAAALCAMTAELSARRLAHAPQLAADARGLLRRAAPLAQADADAYGDVLAAQRAADDPAGRPRKQRISAALAQASVVPLEVAEIGDRVAALAAEIAARGNPAVRGDALTAARLAPPRRRRPRHWYGSTSQARRTIPGRPGPRTWPPARRAWPRRPRATPATPSARATDCPRGDVRRHLLVITWKVARVGSAA